MNDFNTIMEREQTKEMLNTIKAILEYMKEAKLKEGRLMKEIKGLKQMVKNLKK